MLAILVGAAIEDSGARTAGDGGGEGADGNWLRKGSAPGKGEGGTAEEHGRWSGVGAVYFGLVSLQLEVWSGKAYVRQEASPSHFPSWQRSPDT